MRSWALREGEARSFRKIWSSGDLTGVSHDFVATGTLTLNGKRIVPVNTGAATVLACNANGLSIEANAVCDLDGATDSGPGFYLEPADFLAGGPFLDWVWDIDWGAVSDTTSGYKYSTAGVDFVASTVDASHMFVGLQSSAYECRAKRIVDSVTEFDSNNPTLALQQAARNLLRVAYMYGKLEFFGKKAGEPWVRIGEISGDQKPTTLIRPSVRHIGNSVVGFQTRITQMNFYTRVRSDISFSP